MSNQPIRNPEISSPLKPENLYKFESLLPGDELDSENDSNTLSHLLSQQKGYNFSWEYQETEPRKWSILLGKPKTNFKTQTLGDMAVSDHRKALILRNYGLDFSFNGKKTLQEACAEQGISTWNIERELAATGQQSLVYTINYNSWELDYLADFILTNHHQYTRKTLLNIEQAWEKSDQKNYSFLQPLFEVFDQLHTTIRAIMMQEEQVLFPGIRFLVQAAKGRIGRSVTPTGSILDHISNIESLHKILIEHLAFVRKFTANFTLPNIEYSFYEQVLQWLNEFDSDLHQHIHIEKNILFPKAIKLEQEYIKNFKDTNVTTNKVSTPTNYQSAIL